MKITLTTAEKLELENRHKKERDGRVRDRIKAVLLRSEGWKQTEIAQALRIGADTVYDHLSSYIKENSLKPLNGGSLSKLNKFQTDSLIKHLEYRIYDKVSEICAYVQKEYELNYIVSGITKWLHTNRFSYKKPKGTPHKACTKKQEEFIEKYLALTSNLPADEVIEFGDGVHPTMATKITSGWIRKGKNKLISATASKTRINLFGSINLCDISVTINKYDTIDSKALENHFICLKNKYPNKKALHLILDQGSYNASTQTLKAAKKYGITIHHLPTYSQNLNRNFQVE